MPPNQGTFKNQIVKFNVLRGGYAITGNTRRAAGKNHVRRVFATPSIVRGPDIYEEPEVIDHSSGNSPTSSQQHVKYPF